MNASLTDTYKNFSKLSDGWFTKFKRWWGSRTIKSHEESEDTDISAVENARPMIKERIAAYECKNVWNVDECELFYKMAPGPVMAFNRMEGGKNSRTGSLCLSQSKQMTRKSFRYFSSKHPLNRVQSRKNSTALRIELLRQSKGLDELRALFWLAKAI